MITVVSHPDKILKKLTNEFLFALINREFGIILGKISHEHGKWTNERLQTEVLAATRGRWVSEFLSINGLPPPALTGDQKLYEYRHRLPIGGRWSETELVLRLHHKQHALYALELVGFVRSGA